MHFVQTEYFHRVPSMTFIKDIGRGSNGKISLVEVAGTLCIAKRPHDSLSTTQKAANNQLDFYRELLVLPCLHHPNIVQYMGVYCSPHHDLALIIEYMSIDLDKVLSVCHNQFPLSLQLSILMDVSLGMQYLHSRGIIHCDLTPDNILLSTALNAKICDLGSSNILGSRDAKGYTHTTKFRFWAYLPPEVFKPNFLYTEKQDTFCFGVLSLFVATQKFPERYMGENVSQEAIDKKQIELERHGKVLNLLTPKYCLAPLIKKCLYDTADERPTASEITHCLKYWTKHFPKRLQDVMFVNDILHNQLA